MMNTILRISVYAAIVGMAYMIGEFRGIVNSTQVVQELVLSRQLKADNFSKNQIRYLPFEYHPKIFQISDSQIVVIDTIHMSQIRPLPDDLIEKVSKQFDVH